MKVVTGAIVALIVGGCAFSTSPPTVAWANRVPTPGPEAIANQPVIERGIGTVTLAPISPRGAVLGVDYAYDMPHCGIRSPIDVDGSFWDAVGVAPNSVDFDGSSGTFRLTDATTAIFTQASTGRQLQLLRHDGPKVFPTCD
ncbi:MAG: hypothetical protein V4515_11465 [Chloroflexota bacterium]